MKQKLLLTLMFLVTWGMGSVWADEPTDAQYSAALANITAGTYRIYAMDGSTKRYLKKDFNAIDKGEGNVAKFTTTFSEAAEYTISMLSTSGTVTSGDWQIYLDGYCFTNPKSTKPELTGYLRGHTQRNTGYDSQVLYYNGSAFAIKACNKNDDWGNWYWGLDTTTEPSTTNPGYQSLAAYIWHFERVVPEGYYRIYGNAYNNQSLSYLLTNAEGTALANSHDGGNNAKDRPYTGSDNKDVWYISAGVADGTYSIKNVSNNKYIQINAGNQSNGSNALSDSQQDVCFTDYYQYIGANSTHSHRFINLNKNTIYVYKGPDANNQFTLYPMSAYTLTVTGLTNQSVTVENNNHKSAATNAETVYIDSRATTAEDLTVTTNYDDLTATVSSFTDGAVSVAVGYNRTFATPEQCYTVCLPFALSNEEVAAISGKFYTLNSYADNTLHFEEVSSTDAYTPYLFKPSVANVTISSSNYTLVDYAAQSLTTTVSANAASFIGRVAEATLKSGDGYTLYGYRASDGKFVQIGSDKGAHINPFRAYICIPGVSEVKSFNVKFDDSETTGIEAVNGAGFKATGSEAYDLQGRRVSNPTRGLYIINGKKAVIK